MGGIEVDPNIPEGMEFIPSSVLDGEYDFVVASTGEGEYISFRSNNILLPGRLALAVKLNFIVCAF